MINSTSMLGKHNPRWPSGNAQETIKVLDVGPPGQRGPEIAGSLADPFRNAIALVIAWLRGLPRRVGNRLFASNDEEASWHGWQVKELSGGLGRQYRDPRFDTMRDRFDPNGGRVESDPRRGTQQAPWLGGFIPGVPEAWDDHWNGEANQEGDPREAWRRHRWDER